ncbi:uncharacterized protein LOC106642427 [Copidosoma floridanum]|uniref:uncharacterized protein LOC106642427 n=1 Tax=Copidosoma floridanum TaxID=29053 RepID=UPI0006C9CDF1|nr:uncharacterized protein LOC106642427 [Copidosoma floridanum]
MDWRRTLLTILLMTIARHSTISTTEAAQIPPLSTVAVATGGMVSIADTVQIECARESIIVQISTEGNANFHGFVYPRGLSKNSSCLHEYRSQPAPITYTLPLRSCNTMPSELHTEGRMNDRECGKVKRVVGLQFDTFHTVPWS